MRILVTGHKGYIGSHLFKKLKNLGHEVAGIDLKGCDIGEKELPGEDICEGFPTEFYEFVPEFIFHLAAIPRVGYSILNPEEVMKNNIISTTKTLKLAKHLNAPLVYSSSSSVVGNGNGPTSPYALSKYVGELESVMYDSLYDVKTVSLRYFNVYSGDQKADGPYATAVANWMQYIRDNKVPFITGDGSQRRDMAHVEDVVSANIFCIDEIDKIRGSVFDVGTGSNISLNEMKEIVNSVFPDIAFETKPPRPGEVLITKAETKAFKNFGWSARIDIQEGIKECFKALKGEIE
jgi:nucleoside-diphosphate-sugar epimerase|tara:strand:+ start:1935 stop:2810 length:876 start_codon:yes stop_codon:yes gene_type:complete